MSVLRILWVAAIIAGSGNFSTARAAGPKLLGIVSISATEANNARYIAGATTAARADGWTVSVIDAAGSADQANAAMENFANRGAAAIIDMVFPFSSVGAGLAAAKSAGIPVVTWGGGLGGTIAATNGSGAPIAEPLIGKMFADLGAKGSLLALIYRTGEVCRNRERLLDTALKQHLGITVTKNEVRIPGTLEDGAQYANAWLASHPAGNGKLAIWGCWDDPAVGAISALRGQDRNDVLVYGVNGNAQAIENIRDGHMTATAWEDSAAEGRAMVKLLDRIRAAGSGWVPKAEEVAPVLVTRDSVAAFLRQHPGAAGG